MLNESKNITDYFDIDFLQMMQDNYSKALGMAFVMVDYRGRPITKYSGFTHFCQLGRGCQDFFEKCRQCDAHAALQAVLTGQPYIYLCHARLVDFALPLMRDGIYVGSLMGGQIRLNPEEEERLEMVVLAKPDREVNKELDDAYQNVQMGSFEKIKSSVTLLRDLLEFMMQSSTQADKEAGRILPASGEIEPKAAGSVELPQRPGDRGEQRREYYLTLFNEQLKTFSYKKCAETLTEYLDSLYAEVKDTNEIRSQAIAFADGMVCLGGFFDAAIQTKLSGVLEQFKCRFGHQVQKYETYLTLKKMLDIMFAVFGSEHGYQIGSEQSILNYVDSNLRGGLSLEQAAEYANMSSYYFSRFFKKITGDNFITYVMDCKITSAKRLLMDTDLPVANIAYELAYRDANYFSKVFKRKVGMTPTEYRERYGGAKEISLNGQKNN